MPESSVKGLQLPNGLSNLTVPRGLISQLPRGRDLEGQSAGCPILIENNTLYLLIEGWEGIPTNLILNIVFSSVS